VRADPGVRLETLLPAAPAVRVNADTTRRNHRPVFAVPPAPAPGRRYRESSPRRHLPVHGHSGRAGRGGNRHAGHGRCQPR
jgi:hypothetical protein